MGTALPFPTIFPANPPILFRFFVGNAYSAARILNGASDRSTTLLGFQCRPAPLSLGHTLRKGQGDVAWGVRQTRRYPGPQAGPQGGPCPVLPLGTGALPVFDRR